MSNDIAQLLEAYDDWQTYRGEISEREAHGENVGDDWFDNDDQGVTLLQSLAAALKAEAVR